MFVAVYKKIRSLRQKVNQWRYWTAMLQSILSWRAFPSGTFPVKEWCVDVHSGMRSANHTLSNTPALAAARCHKVPSIPEILCSSGPRRLEEILLWTLLCSPCDMSCRKPTRRVRVRRLGCSAQPAVGAFLTSPPLLFPVVYGRQVHQCGEEAREHSWRLGPLVALVPLLQDLRGRGPERGEALQQPQVSAAKHPPLPWAGRPAWPLWHRWPTPAEGNQWGRWRFPEGEQIVVLPCFIWAWHRALARTWINKRIPSLGEISTFLLKGKPPGGYAVKASWINHTISRRSVRSKFADKIAAFLQSLRMYSFAKMFFFP